MDDKVHPRNVEVHSRPSALDCKPGGSKREGDFYEIVREFQLSELQNSRMR